MHITASAGVKDHSCHTLGKCTPTDVAGQARSGETGTYTISQRRHTATRNQCLGGERNTLQTLRAVPRRHVQEVLLRRKVGRPIQYSGDPLAPDMTSLERKTLSRRIANRNSARRVREHRQERLDNLFHEAQEKKSDQEALISRLTEAESQVLDMMREVTTARLQVCLKNREGDELRSEIVKLKGRLAVLHELKAEASRQEQSRLPYYREFDLSAQFETGGDDEMLPQLWELCEDPQLAVI